MGDGVTLGPGGRQPCGRGGTLALARQQSSSGGGGVDGCRQQAGHDVVVESLGCKPEQRGGRRPVTGRTRLRGVVLGAGRDRDPVQREDGPRPPCPLDAGPLGGDLGVAAQECVAFAGCRGVPIPLLRGRPSGVEVAAGRPLGHPERRQRGGQGAGEVLGRRRQLGTPGEGCRLGGWEGRLRGLADPVHEPVHGPFVLLAATVQRKASVAQPGLHLLEPLRAEELLEQPVPVLRRRTQERLEAALREHRHLGELGEVHPDEGRHQVPGLVEPGRERHPTAIEPFADDHRRLLRGGAGATLLRPGPGGRALDAEPTAGQRRLEHHPRCGVGIGLVGP